MQTLISNSADVSILTFIHIRGRTFSQQIKFYQDAAKTLPRTIVGSTFKMNVIKNDRSAPVLSFTLLGGGLTITSPNILNLNKTATQMRIPAGVYRYDLEETDGSSVITTKQRGQFVIVDNETD